MSEAINKLNKNDRVQNQFALYYLLEYGRNNMLDEKFLSNLKEEVKARDDKHSIIANEFAIGAINIANDMAKLDHQQIHNFIYEEIKKQKRQEKSR